MAFLSDMDELAVAINDAMRQQTKEKKVVAMDFFQLVNLAGVNDGSQQNLNEMLADGWQPWRMCDFPLDDRYDMKFPVIILVKYAGEGA